MVAQSKKNTNLNSNKIISTIMKSLKSYIQEKLIIKKSNNNYKYFPKTKKELKDIILQRIEAEGNEVDLNDIDVSEITDMSELFKNFFNFRGNISQWDVSNVTDMQGMFHKCEAFNQDISSWNVSNVTNMNRMFWGCNKFNQDISGWDVSNVKKMNNIFKDCSIEEKHKPKFK